MTDWNQRIAQTFAELQDKALHQYTAWSDGELIILAVAAFVAGVIIGAWATRRRYAF